MKMKYAWATAVALAAMAHVASATLMPITNHSFEDPVLADGAYSGSNPTGWTFTSGVNWGAEHIADDRFGGNNPLPAPGDGVNVAYINIGGGGTGSATSDVIGQTVAGNTYTLTIAIAERASGDANPDGSIGLYVGGVAAGTFTDYTGVSLTDGALTDIVYSYTATTTGDDIQVRMDFTHGGQGWEQAQFDNVRLDAVPEPATMSLVALFGGAVLFIRRKLMI